MYGKTVLEKRYCKLALDRDGGRYGADLQNIARLPAFIAARVPAERRIFVAAHQFQLQVGTVRMHLQREALAPHMQAGTVQPGVQVGREMPEQLDLVMFLGGDLV